MRVVFGDAALPHDAWGFWSVPWVPTVMVVVTREDVGHWAHGMVMLLLLSPFLGNLGGPSEIGKNQFPMLSCMSCASSGRHRLVTEEVVLQHKRVRSPPTQSRSEGSELRLGCLYWGC